MDDLALPAPVPPYFGYWGKARPAELHGGTPCHLLPYHSLDVAATGREYLRRAHAFRAFLGRCLAIEDEEVLLSWVSFWLSLHDLGKYSEAFQSQRPDQFVRMRGRMPHPAKAYTERHDSLGMKFWVGCLQQRAWARDVPLPDYWLQAQAVAERALRQSGVLPAARQDATSFATLFPGLRTPPPCRPGRPPRPWTRARSC